MAPVSRWLARTSILAAVALAPAACAEDRSGLARDPFGPEADVTFERYVALGNSITAGVQSGGINDSTQSLAYPVLLAGVFGAPAFPIPALARPGCTPPLERLVPPEYVGGDPDACFGPAASAVGPFQNIAVPGYETADLLVRPAISDPSDPRALQDLFLPPGQSAVQAMMAIDPTFVTLWTGNNDVLGAALAGQPGLATPLSFFAADFREVLDSIAATGAQAAVANVPDVTSIPALLDALRMSGLVDTLQALGFSNISVSNCDDKTGWFVSSLAVTPAFDGTTAVAIDCNATDPFGVDFILTETEVTTLQGVVAAYNDSIAAAVADHGFALVDVHDLFTRAAAVFGPSELRIQDAAVPPADFGDFFSLDGIHPSSFAQRVLANAFIDAINAAYEPIFFASRLPE